MASFRRSSLRGSEELFRPTHPDTGSPATGAHGPQPPDPPVAPAAPPPAPGREAPPIRASEGSLLRLSDDELELLVEAVQRLKFPGQAKSQVRPSMDDFERLEDLRQKLLAARR